MKNKIILLVIIGLMLCGCSAEVNLEVNPSNISETISITTNADSTYTKQNILEGFRNYMPIYNNIEIPDTEPDEPVSGVQYYEHTQEELSNGYKNVYSHTFDFGRYKNARSVNDAFRSVTIQNSSSQKTMLLSTDSGGLKSFNTYPGLETVRVNIKTDYEVIKHNADSVNGNVYTWYFSKDTKKGVYLLMSNTLDKEVEKKETDTTTKKSEKKKSFIDQHPFLIAVLGIITFIILASIMSKIKIKG